MLPGGGQAALVINRGDAAVDVDVTMLELGLQGEGAGTSEGAAAYAARDVWARKDAGEVAVGGNWSVRALGQHDSAFFTFTPKSQM